MSYSHALPNVDNLANSTSTSTLKHIFQEFGPVSDVYISPNHLTKEPDGFAIIHFYNKRDAKDAMDALNGILLYACKLRVQMVHNDDPLYVQPDCGQGGQHHFKKENHEFQSHRKRHGCPTTRIQSRSYSLSSSEHSESRSQSHCLQRRLPSTKNSNFSSSMFSYELPDTPCPTSRKLPQSKWKKSKYRSSCKHDFKCHEGGGKVK